MRHHLSCAGLALVMTFVLPLAATQAQDKQLYWGDLHLHTNISPDAFAFGTRKLGPDAAFSFAKGDEIVSSSGVPAKLARPLDFLSVTDHAELMGIFAGLTDPDFANRMIRYQIPREGLWARIKGWFSAGPAEMTIKDALLTTPIGARWSEYIETGQFSKAMGEFVVVLSSPRTEETSVPPALRLAIWQELVDIAESHNEPGRFTAMLGYEWSSIYDQNNLHRNVIFRDDAPRVRAHLPFSAIDSQDPEDLWAALERYERESKGRVLAIPHNGNLSNGIMFSEEDLQGAPITADYARMRLRFEPVVEITQVKGDGETHPVVSPDDPFADFENWDEGDIGRARAKQPEMLEFEYARSALGVGLRIEERVGVNPYQFGMIGSTDSHTALSTADSDNYFGKFRDSEPSIKRLGSKMGGQLWPNITLSASGFVAVWAEENTREALFDALDRREVYASTGPRIALRFDGGWSADAQQPMGSVLKASAQGRSPVFSVVAQKDSIGANLDRAQIIKGWVDENGARREKIYNIALSDGRSVGPETGRAPPVGSTVNVEEATYENTIGAERFEVTWQDPDFEPGTSAFYYVRVLEIPTPRWSTYDSARFDLPLPEDVPAQIQERVYSSPIWYIP